ncbi:MAG: hypothetical protein WBA93_29000 [Microcoleaceae cyanobacterium]
MRAKNEEKQAQDKRRNQTASGAKDNQDCGGRVEGASGQVSDIKIGISGANWQEANIPQFFICGTLGKILDRLITSWQDREKEAVDCLDWYQNQVEKCQQEIKSLEDIKAELAKNVEQE